MQDPKVQDHYLKEYKGQCSQQKLFTRAKALWDQITLGNPLTLLQQEEYEEIDRLKPKQCSGWKSSDAN